MNFRYYTIRVAMCITIIAILILSSCSKESDCNFTPEGKPGIAFSLHVEQDEVTAGQMTRAGGAEVTIKQMKYFIKKKTEENMFEIVNSSQKFLSSDFSKLTIEGLEEGEYAIIFYATTQSGESMPQPADDGTLTNPYNEKPLNVDYLFARVEFSVDGTKGEISQNIPVNLKRCVGQVKIELKGSYYERRLIKGMDISIINTDDITTKHLDYESTYADNMYSTITDLSLEMKEIKTDFYSSFYSFPSKPGTTLTGTIKINSASPDGTDTSTKNYMFHDLKIEEGKVSRIQLNWNIPDGNGVIYIAPEDINPTNSYEMFQKGESEEKIKKRTFDTDKPFQMELDENQKLHTAFYGPVTLHDVKIMCRMEKYSEEFFQIAYYEKYPAFYETRLELPVIKKETTFRTESGKPLIIPAQPELSAADCEFKIVNSDEYMRNINKITYPMKIIFNHKRASGVQGQFQTPVSPRYGRLACILAVNFSALFSSKEFEDGVRNYKDIPFVADTAHMDKVIPPDEVIRLARATKELKITELHHVSDPVLGEVSGTGAAASSYGPAIIGLRNPILDWQLPEGIDQNEMLTIYHEYGHVMGFSHNSTFSSYEPKFYGWQRCCIGIIRKMIGNSALPVNAIKRDPNVWNVIQAAQ